MKYYVDYLDKHIADKYGNKVDTPIVAEYKAAVNSERARYNKLMQPLEAEKQAIDIYENAAATVAKIADDQIREATDDKAYVFMDYEHMTLHYVEYDTDIDITLTETNAAEFGVNGKYVHAFEYLVGKQAAAYDEYQSTYKFIEESIADEHHAKTADIINKYMEEIPMPNIGNRISDDGIIWNNSQDAKYALLHYILGNYKPNLSVYFD